jgi:hypothetical protein
MSSRSAYPALDQPALQAGLTHRLWDYALRRQQAVQAGHETADLAGVLVQHFGSGMVEAVRALLGPDGEVVATPLLVAVDQAMAHLDPAWDHHATQRWAARPARLAYD